MVGEDGSVIQVMGIVNLLSIHVCISKYWQELAGHKTPEFVLWLFAHGIMGSVAKLIVTDCYLQHIVVLSILYSTL
jgi:hypothetical protein